MILGNILATFTNAECDPGITLLSLYLTEMHSYALDKINNSNIHNANKLEIIQLFISTIMDKWGYSPTREYEIANENK